MRQAKALILTIVVAGVAAFSIPQPAHARWGWGGGWRGGWGGWHRGWGGWHGGWGWRGGWGRWHGGGWGWGAAAVGAGIAAGALAYPHYGYPGYYGYPAYYGDDCYLRQVWGPYGLHWVRVCH